MRRAPSQRPVRRRSPAVRGRRPLTGALLIFFGLVAIAASVAMTPRLVDVMDWKGIGGCAFLVVFGLLGIVLGVSLIRGTASGRRRSRRMPRPHRR